MQPAKQRYVILRIIPKTTEASPPGPTAKVATPATDAGPRLHSGPCGGDLPGVAWPPTPAIQPKPSTTGSGGGLPGVSNPPTPAIQPKPGSTGANGGGLPGVSNPPKPAILPRPVEVDDGYDDVVADPDSAYDRDLPPEPAFDPSGTEPQPAHTLRASLRRS